MTIIKTNYNDPKNNDKKNSTNNLKVLKIKKYHKRQHIEIYRIC